MIDKKMIANLKGGRNSVTHFKKLMDFSEPKKNPFACLVEAQLETGRTHQVRVHLTSLGHSILGDSLYGKPTSRQNKWKTLPDTIKTLVGQVSGQFLHARTLGFIHPVTKEKLHFEADVPTLYSTLLEELRKYS